MGAGVVHSAFAAHIKVIVFWEPAERQLDVGGRQALLAEEAGSHRRRHRRCYTLRSPDRLRTMCLYGSMPHSTGTGSQGEPADPVGGRHLSGRKLIEARHRLRWGTSGLQRSNCVTFTFKISRHWMQQRRLLYLQFWATVELKAARSKIIVLSWQFWIGLMGFFFKNPSYNFQCICVLCWPI